MRDVIDVNEIAVDNVKTLCYKYPCAVERENMTFFCPDFNKGAGKSKAIPYK